LTIVDGVPIAPGHTVRSFRSRRFRAEAVLDIFDERHWSLRPPVFDEENEHAVVIATRMAGGSQ
jgi:hypothetical protein